MEERIGENFTLGSLIILIIYNRFSIEADSVRDLGT
jgi:hypothetical protein